MKPLILLALLFPFCAHAQHSTAVNKTTSTPLRLIASTLSKPSGTDYYVTDSSVYTYSGSRSFNYNPCVHMFYNGYNNFDSSIAYSNDTAAHAYTINTITLQSFNTHDNFSDLAKYTWNSATSAWQMNYDIQGYYTYDVANHVLIDSAVRWNPYTSSWQNFDQYFYTYDAGGRMITDMDQQWNASTSTWQNHSRHNFTYDASGNMLTDSLEAYFGGWVNYSKHTYTYTGSDMISDQYQEWSASSWENNSIISYSDYISGVPQASISEIWNSSATGYDSLSKSAYSYNSYGQPDYIYYHEWNNFTSTWEDKTKTHYYYAFPSAVGGVLAKENAISIYPVPAEHTLNVAVEWTEPQPFTVSIYDMAGKLHNSWDITSCAKYTQGIPVSDLAPGNYIIRLQGTRSSESRQITIKQ